MTARMRVLRISMVVLTLVLAGMLATPSSQYAWAKGVTRSEGSSDRSSGGSSRDSGSDRSAPARSSESSTTNRSAPPPASNRSAPPPSSNRSTSPAPTVRQPAPPVIYGGTRTDNRAERTTPQDTRGLNRREYEDIGRIWRERQERRTTAPERWHGTYRTHTRSTYFGINYYFPGRYSYYGFDYLPGRVYPSVYCFYYGIYPPYVQSTRVVFVNRGLGIRYTYVDLPIVLRSRSYSYYDVDYDDYYYYTSDVNYRTLTSTLDNVQRAWERGDIDLLRRHVRSGSRIDIMLQGEYAYSVDRQDYLDMTIDAMRNIRTSSFRFDRTRLRNSREAVAYGKHVYYDESDSYSYYGGTRKTVYFSYTFERSGNDWYITEVGSSPKPLL